MNDKQSENAWSELVTALSRAKMYAEAACGDLRDEWPDNALTEQMRDHAARAANDLGNALWAAREGLRKLRAAGEVRI